MSFIRLPLLAAMLLAFAASGAPAQTSAKPPPPPPAASKPAGKVQNNGSSSSGARAAAMPASAGASYSPIVVGPAASTTATTKPQPRPLTRTESRQSAEAPGELYPERPITPQLSIPLTRKSTGPASLTTRTPGSPTPGTINDAAVRCAAIADDNERALCRERAGLGSGKP